jgi:hypothetical protein
MNKKTEMEKNCTASGARGYLRRNNAQKPGLHVHVDRDIKDLHHLYNILLSV